MKTFLEEIQDFFFRAMLQGWVADGEKVSIPGMPGYQAFPFAEGDFYLLDCYVVNPESSKSAGTTTIWYQEKPVWVMLYRGLYQEDAIPVVKAALLETYHAGRFIGGRGPKQFKMGNLEYTNDAPNDDQFTSFQGSESVRDTTYARPSLGWHRYWGMSLI